jgi:hypothetical protein
LAAAIKPFSFRPRPRLNLSRIIISERCAACWGRIAFGFNHQLTIKLLFFHQLLFRPALGGQPCLAFSSRQGGSRSVRPILPEQAKAVKQFLG